MSVDRDPPRAALQEAVQPSLWDRLVDDLPGLQAETKGLNAELVRRAGLSATDVDALIAGGPRAIAAHPDLDDDSRALAHRLITRDAQRRRLADGGIVVTPEVLREAVRRDIEMLFNIERLEAEFLLTEREALDHPNPASVLADFPEVRASVVNYGVPSFSGRIGSDFDTDALARTIREVLAVFEPRLRKDGLSVRVRVGDKTGMRIEIDGMLLMSPVPERLRLSTSIDLDNGQAVTALEDR